MTQRPLILMTDPSGFDVHYAINPWMQPALWLADPDGFRKAARRAFASLVDALTRAGAAIEVLAGTPGLPDMVFPANAAVVLDRRALLGRFRPRERRGEEARFLANFRSLEARGLLDEVVRLREGLYQEGAGDCIWDAARGIFWAGYGQRSSRQAADDVAAFFGREIVPLKLASPRFYHLDTCFCPLMGGDIIYYPPAFSPRTLGLIRDRVPTDQLIEASEADAAGFCINAVCVDRTVVMATAPTRLQDVLGERGYAVSEVDLAPFILSGGAAFCMTLRLDQTSASPAVGSAPHHMLQEILP